MAASFTTAMGPGFLRYSREPSIKLAHVACAYTQLAVAWFASCRVVDEDPEYLQNYSDVTLMN